MRLIHYMLDYFQLVLWMGALDGLDNILRDFDLLNNKKNNNSNNSNNICNQLEETRNSSRKGVKGLA